MEVTAEVSRTPRAGITVADLATLVLITALALAVHGFHYGIEDEAIYLPAIKKSLNQSLYPFDSLFFLSQTNLTIFPQVIASIVRMTSLPLASIVFTVYLLSIFLTLAACWQLSRRCFADVCAQWAAVVMVASLLTLPVAGTALYLMDQHLHPRSLTTAAVLWSLSNLLDGNYYRAGSGLIIALLVHPLMGAFGVLFAIFLLWKPYQQLSSLGFAALLLIPLPVILKPPSPAWHEAVLGSPYYFLLHWEWYEWVGILAPLGLLIWFGYLVRGNGLEILRLMSWRLAAFGLIFFILAALLTIPARFERAVPFQPMRFLHLVYLLFFMLAGGLLGKWILRDRPFRWLILFAPICILMFFAQRQQFSASPHVEWPGVMPQNGWLQSFEWIRQNTPPDALFALDPHYLESPGLDHHGFRALAERSMLADRSKDRTVATLAPAIADIWLEQVKSREDWKDFRLEEFLRLKQQYGVTWVVLENGGKVAPPVGLTCPYSNELVSVCRID